MCWLLYKYPQIKILLEYNLLKNKVYVSFMFIPLEESVVPVFKITVELVKINMSIFKQSSEFSRRIQRRKMSSYLGYRKLSWIIGILSTK